MALKLSTIADGTLEVISRIDSAISPKMDADKFNEYLRTLDESVLEFVEGEKPTRFVLRKVLPWGLAQKVQNKQAKLEKGEVQFQLGYQNEEVRCALIGIKNPDTLAEDEHIKYERGSDGGASEELMSKLIAAGIANDLWIARSNATAKTKTDLKKT